jgi:protein gp37
MAQSAHPWLLLTKRPDRMTRFSLAHRLPDNVWCWTSITRVQDQRIRHLTRMRCALRFVSYEPIHAPINVKGWKAMGISWILIGAESDDTRTERIARPTDLEVIRATLDDCRAEGLVPFVKQIGSRPMLNGKPFPIRDGKGGDWSEWPDDVRVRDMPTPRRPVR